MQFATSHVGGTTNIWRKVLWSDETKIYVFDLTLCVAENYHPEHYGIKIAIKKTCA